MNVVLFLSFVPGSGRREGWVGRITRALKSLLSPSPLLTRPSQPDKISRKPNCALYLIA